VRLHNHAQLYWWATERRINTHALFRVVTTEL
jgi:hypothetical protein